MNSAGRDTPLDELLSRFLQYRRELHDLRTKSQAAEESSARGESKELDVEMLIAEVTQELASEGVTDQPESSRRQHGWLSYSGLQKRARTSR
jgi:hypothetical protein